MLLILLAVLQQTPAVGITAFHSISAEPAETVQAILWYPTGGTPHDTTLGLRPARVAAGGSLASAARRYPLVLISHGTGGNEFGHQDLALALAQAGFVVVSVRHPGDNSYDNSGVGTDRYFYGRSHHIALTLDGLLADPTWGPHLDSGRVGFFGYSIGGFTGLTLLGAAPDFQRMAVYCALRPNDAPYCVHGATSIPQLGTTYLRPRADPRIKAAALMAPAFSFLFDSLDLARIHVPVFIGRAGADAIVQEPENVTWLEHSLRTLEPVQLIPMAGHYVFLAPCSEALAARVPFICVDPAGVDRAAVHADLNPRLVAFFRRALGLHENAKAS
jgi:predicted dienelactone hydrolase